jgi:aminoglycoside 6'-N-acetyltransferase I
MQVRPYSERDRDELERLVRLLFPDEADAEWEDLALRLERTPLYVLDCGDGRLGGYVEAGTRAYAEGCETSPVAYVEAWYIDDELRRQGWGARLIGAVERWALDEGLSELASDALVANQRSIDAHKAIGFEEVERHVCFRKRLTAG